MAIGNLPVMPSFLVKAVLNGILSFRFGSHNRGTECQEEEFDEGEFPPEQVWGKTASYEVQMLHVAHLRGESRGTMRLWNIGTS